MAEEVNIIIKAVDEASKQLELINKNLNNLNSTTKISSKTQADATKSFETSLTSMIALGNTANSVNHIFDSYNNLQMRIENAELRVIDARERVNELIAEGKEGTKEYNDAVNRLTISQNNLERTQSRVIDTYINIGIQTASIINSIPTLIKGINSSITALSKLSDIGRITMTSLGPIVAIISGLATVGYLLYNHFSDSNDEFERSNGLTPIVASYGEDIANAYSKVKDEIGKATDNMRIFIETAMPGELEFITNRILKEEELRLKKLELFEIDKQIREQGNSAGIELRDKQANLKREIEMLQEKVKLLRDEEGLRYFDARENQKELNELVKKHPQLLSLIPDAMKKAFGLEEGDGGYFIVKADLAIKTLDNDTANYIKTVATAIQKTEELINKGEITGTRTDLTPKGNFPVNFELLSKQIKQGGDFIITKNGEIIESHPDDTILATKNGLGGTSYNINIENVYGVDATDIAMALQEKLINQIRV
jgi:hypothetical protein